MMLHMFNGMKWDCYILCLAWNEIWIGWLVVASTWNYDAWD